MSDLEWELFADLLPQPPADIKVWNAIRTVWEDIEYLIVHTDYWLPLEKLKGRILAITEKRD